MRKNIALDIQPQPSNPTPKQSLRKSANAEYAAVHRAKMKSFLTSPNPEEREKARLFYERKRQYEKNSESRRAKNPTYVATYHSKMKSLATSENPTERERGLEFIQKRKESYQKTQSKRTKKN